MTARDALLDGNLSESIRLQREVVEAQPGDDAARLFLFELLTLQGRLNEAREELVQVSSTAASWPATRTQFMNILKAQVKRRRAAPVLSGNPTIQVQYRRRAWRAYRRGEMARLRRLIDRADEHSPFLVGHVDGREFDGARDFDDRFATVLEVFSGADYTWLPLEHVQQLTLQPAVGVLDVAFRPATVRIQGNTIPVVLPLIYPETHWADETFSCGQESDFMPEPDIAIGIGAKLWFLGDEELLLGDCKQIELRTA